MTALATALKDEIRRLARKEIKAQTGRTTKAVAQYRRDIAQLKRQQRELEKRLALLESREAVQPSPAVNGDARFSARSVKSQRRRTGLSAADYAKLVGVFPADNLQLGEQEVPPSQWPTRDVGSPPRTRQTGRPGQAFVACGAKEAGATAAKEVARLWATGDCCVGAM
jgi:hypothetical protein